MSIELLEPAVAEKTSFINSDDILPMYSTEVNLHEQPQLITLGKEHADQMATLHIEGIKTGFISSLGINFVTTLYEGIVENSRSLGFVTDEGKLLGFVCFAENIGKLYKTIILKKGVLFAFFLARKMISFSRIKKVFETLFYPSRTEKLNLPSTELLSIVVSPEARRLGYAAQLGQKGIEEYQKLGQEIKVLVAADNEPANKLYRSLGFELAQQTHNHGIPSNIYVTGLRPDTAIEPSETHSSREHYYAKRLRYIAGKLKPAAAAILFAVGHLFSKL